MIREIKFRAKYFDEWYFGIIVTRKVNDRGRMRNLYILMGLDNENWIPLNEDQYDTIGQFTGLHDKNGKEIYEGDIVKFNGKFFTGNNIFCVDYEGSHRGGFSLCTKDGYYSMFGEAWLEPFYCEVIGNIHDNPELLKGGEQ